MDAVSQPATVLRAVGEHMAEVAVAVHRAHLGADHAKGVVAPLFDVLRHDRLGEARPAAAGLELVARGEQRLAGNDVDVDARLLVVVVLAREGPFGAVLLGHLVLRRRKLPDRCVGLCVFHRPGSIADLPQYGEGPQGLPVWGACWEPMASWPSSRIRALLGRLVGAAQVLGAVQKRDVRERDRQSGSRERVGQYVLIAVVGVYLKKK